MKKKHVLIFFLQILFCNYVFSQDRYVWEGGFSNNWNDASNWSPKLIPSATDRVEIPKDRPNYPVLNKDVTLSFLWILPGSQIDFNGHQINIHSYETIHNVAISNATLNNSAPGTDIIINISGAILTTFSIRNTIVNDNIIFNIASPGKFSDADYEGANTFNGNVTYNINGIGDLHLSSGFSSKYMGDLTIIRNVEGGETKLFHNGDVTIKGNFKFRNDFGGGFTMGRGKTFPSTIDGKVDISIKNTKPANLGIYGINNKTSGGVVESHNAQKFEVNESTLKLKSLRLTGYHGNGYSELKSNDITGNIFISDNPDYKSTYYHTTLKSNKFTGNTEINLNSGNIFWEARQVSDGSHYIGNVIYNLTGAVSVFIGEGGVSTYDGNLIINRTGNGPTKMFNVGAIINGNFSYTNNTAGNVTIGSKTIPTKISGKVDIAINDTLSSGFELFRVINQTTGGNVRVQNSKGFNIQYDTLKINSLQLSAYKGETTSLFLYNDITGNVTFEDHADHPKSLSTSLQSNKINGNTQIILNSDQTFNEAHAQRSANHFAGDITYTINSKAILNVSNRDQSVYDGNLTINRIGSGLTQAFDAGAIIRGNFSFTNNTSGDAIFGNLTKPTTISGKIDIAINDTFPSKFNLFNVTNQTNGGSISVKNSRGFRFQNDTLKISSLSITGYKANESSLLYNNDITGNVEISNDASYYNSTQLQSNKITGNTILTNNTSLAFNDAPYSNTGNHYVGDVTYNNQSNGTFSIGSGDTTRFGGDVLLKGAKISLYKIKFVGNNNNTLQQIDANNIIGQQKISNIPTINVYSLEMNKNRNATIILKNPVIASDLKLTSGIIAPDENSHLAVRFSTSGGSASSYVDGPMVKIGNQAFTFPLGQNNVYAPLSISAPGSSTDEFRAQYIAKAAHEAGYDSSKKDAALNQISGSEYWLLDRIAGNSNVSVTLSWSENRSGSINDISSLRVAKWNGSTWKNLGKGPTTGTIANGTIATEEPVTGFSPFTLASSNALNPLPVTISRFNASKNKQSVSLNWTTEKEINLSHFEVERADGNNHFSSIGKVPANNGQAMQYYSFEDNQPLKGVNLYRLNLVGADGRIVYSNVRSILFNENSTITIYPNPAIDFIQIDGIKEGVAIDIHDGAGKLVKRITSNASNKYPVNDLRKGTYFIKLIDKENTTISKLIIQ